MLNRQDGARAQLEQSHKRHVRSYMRWWQLSRQCCAGRQSSLAFKQVLTNGRCPVTVAIDDAAYPACELYNFTAVGQLFSRVAALAELPAESISDAAEASAAPGHAYARGWLGDFEHGCRLTRSYVQELVMRPDFTCDDLIYFKHYGRVSPAEATKSRHFTALR